MLYVTSTNERTRNSYILVVTEYYCRTRARTRYTRRQAVAVSMLLLLLLLTVSYKQARPAQQKNTHHHSQARCWTGALGCLASRGGVARTTSRVTSSSHINSNRGPPSDKKMENRKAPLLTPNSQPDQNEASPSNPLQQDTKTTPQQRQLPCTS